MVEYKDSYEGSRALIVGIDSYSDPRFEPLGNAEADAEAVAELLSSAPFNFSSQVLLGAEATKEAILEGLHSLRDTQANDRILVYFSGHGYPLENQRGHEIGYLACADSRPDRDYTALELDRVTGLRDYSKAKHIGFIFDCCFSGQALGMTKASPAASRYLERRAYQVITAGAGDQTVTDYKSMTGEMIRQIQAYIETGKMLTLSELGLNLKEKIAARSKSGQIPQTGHLDQSQGGEFVLYEPPPGKAIENLPPRLSRGLSSTDADTRYFAIDKAQALLNDPEYGEAVREVLDEMMYTDPDIEIRRRAGQALQAAVASPPSQAQEIPPSPRVDYEAKRIYEILREFKKSNPNTKEWIPKESKRTRRAWIKNNNYSVAICYNGELYPVKEIYRLVAKKEDFISQEAQRFFEKNDLLVLEKDKWEDCDNSIDIQAIQEFKSDNLILSILPEPFEWSDIAGGEVTVEDKTITVEAYQLAKYTVTNAHFQSFVDATDGYRDAGWWDYSKEAKQWRSKNNQPQSPAFDGEADHPRVNVTWFESVAFCRWLSSKVGYEVYLPTEQQWQRAAQGDDGREYPWGNEEPSYQLANYGYNDNVGQTTAVGSYPDGASPYGVMDMSGNVWEWCLTDYEAGSNDSSKKAEYRVLRGGSWNDSSSTALRVAYRGGVSPDNSFYDLGFRCARSKK